MNNRVIKEFVNFKKMEEIKCGSNVESTLFHDGIKAYKLYKRYVNINLKEREEKLDILTEGPLIPNVIIPEEKIVNLFGHFRGHTMKYIPNSTAMFDFFTKTDMLDDFFLIIDSISKDMRRIHEDHRKIIIGDCHFYNIILDENMNHYFVDIDSCGIENIRPSKVTAELAIYLRNNNKEKIATTNTDRISFIFSILYVLLNKDFGHISVFEYEEKAELVPFLERLKPCFLDLKKNDGVIPTVPYIDEFISNSDFERKQKILSLR